MFSHAGSQTPAMAFTAANSVVVAQEPSAVGGPAADPMYAADRGGGASSDSGLDDQHDNMLDKMINSLLDGGDYGGYGDGGVGVYGYSHGGANGGWGHHTQQQQQQQQQQPVWHTHDQAPFHAMPHHGDYHGHEQAQGPGGGARPASFGTQTTIGGIIGTADWAPCTCNDHGGGGAHGAAHAHGWAELPALLDTQQRERKEFASKIADAIRSDTLLTPSGADFKHHHLPPRNPEKGRFPPGPKAGFHRQLHKLQAQPALAPRAAAKKAPRGKGKTQAAVQAAAASLSAARKAADDSGDSDGSGGSDDAPLRQRQLQQQQERRQRQEPEPVPEPELSPKLKFKPSKSEPRGKRPTYLQMCALALVELGNDVMVTALYTWIQERKPVSKNKKPPSKHWKNTVRHALSTSGHFKHNGSGRWSLSQKLKADMDQLPGGTTPQYLGDKRSCGRKQRTTKKVRRSPVKAS